MRYVWDIEANGLLPDVDTVWCLAVYDLDTEDTELFTDYSKEHRSFDEGIAKINEASLWANHSILGYDIPVLEELGYKLVYPDVIVDTLITSQVMYPDITNQKFPHRVPSRIAWSHSLEAWGKRLGVSKGEYDDWSKYTDEMGQYNIQDTVVNAKLFNYLKEQALAMGIAWDFNHMPSPLAIEHKFKKYIMQQTLTGFPFDKKAAQELVIPLMEEKESIEKKLQEVFPPITETIHYVTPKRQEHKTKEKVTVFNPGSRPQIGQRLIDAGWQPSSFTETGRPVINEETIKEASEVVPEAAVLDRFFLLDKRLGSIINGDKAWLRLERNGRIHGEVRTLGAVTTRVTHTNPNMSQVTSVNKPYGKECRALFHAREGWSLVGADLAGIELRCLAHYLYPWDKGAYIDHVLNGDVHTVHQQAFGLPPGKEYRRIGKGGTSMG